MAGQYEKLELLGSGSYGKAWLVNDSKKNRQAVLKEIKFDGLNDKETAQALVEVKVLAKCRHVNIVSYYEMFLHEDCLNIVMEFADSGDMQMKILLQKGTYFDNEVILDWFIQICFALKYLHSENILHRDLKPQNLFLTSDGIVKVGDFGIARILQDTADYAVTAIGTPYYLSPEICERKPYNHKSDMWSVGCVLYELCCLRVPFQGPNLPLLVLKILEGCYDPIPSQRGAVLEDLVKVLLKTDPLQRPSAEQVLNVPALQRQVKATYRKCVSHRQQRHRQRAQSTECISPCLNDNKKADKPSTGKQTYTVRSPLLRRLSVATPKRRETSKRPRAVQSAGDASSVKKQRKTSKPPVLNLHDVMLNLSPSRHKSPSEHRSPSPFKSPPHHKPLSSYKSPRHKSSSPPKSFSDLEYPKKHAIAIVPDQSSEDSQNCDVFEEETSTTKQTNPHSSCSLHGNNDRVGTEQKQLVSDEETEILRTDKPDICLPHTCETTQSLLTKDQRSAKFQAHNEKTHKNHNQVSKIERNRSCSETFTVIDSPRNQEKDVGCSACRNEDPSQQCMYEALYLSTALCSRDKATALRCLSRFLIVHLGSDLSLQLCSMVNSVLCLGGDYSSVQKNLDESYKRYLPVIFQLLILSDNSGTALSK